MTPREIVFGSSLVAVLLGLAFYYGRKQLQVLKKTAGSAEAHSSEGVYLRRQAWRRLVCCALMVLLALMLAGALLFLEEPAQRLAEQGAEAAEAPEHRAFVNFLTYYWIVFLLLLLALVVLAGIDFWAVRRFGLRELKRIQDDRRAMIARQSALLRQKREQEGR